jgi:hypothetical protein
MYPIYTGEVGESPPGKPPEAHHIALPLETVYTDRGTLLNAHVRAFETNPPRLVPLLWEIVRVSTQNCAFPLTGIRKVEITYRIEGKGENCSEKIVRESAFWRPFRVEVRSWESGGVG